MHSPLKGESVLLKEVPDPVFAGGMLGEGIAIKPSEGILYAPCDGRITIIHDTKHAIGMETQNGVEILMHIGLDTVKLQGEFFEKLVNSGQEVNSGEPLLQFDIDGIHEKGYPTITCLIITNSDECEEVTVITKGLVDLQSEVLLVKK